MDTPARKRCLHCDRGLRKEYSDAVKPGYRGNGIFCTLNCGYQYGVMIASHGLRSGTIKP